jgi:hypothetical protein
LYRCIAMAIEIASELLFYVIVDFIVTHYCS